MEGAHGSAHVANVVPGNKTHPITLFRRSTAASQFNFIRPKGGIDHQTCLAIEAW
jgi:hypothetical protein